MPFCPHCQHEYLPPEERCPNCHEKLDQHIETMEQFSYAGTGKRINVGDTYIYGDNSVNLCLICQKPVPPGGRYACSRCHQNPVCRSCYHIEKGICNNCFDELFPVSEATITCSVCRNKVAPRDSFQCSKCLKVACKTHLVPKGEELYCEDCAKKYDRHIAGLRESDNIINKDGTVIDPDDEENLRAIRGRIINAEGESVARIKPTTWYARQWYRTRRKRFKHEQRIMAQFYPQMKLYTDPNGSIYWQGKVKTNWKENKYEVRILYSIDFPYSPPRVYPIEPKIKKSRHIYEDGHLCLLNPDERIWNANVTAATVISWVAKWFHCYEVWLDTGEWPGKEADQVVITTKY